MTDPKPGGPPEPDALRARQERLRALRAAWGVLAPAALGGDAPAAIAERGRALHDEIQAQLSGEGGEQDVAGLDARLDALEREMRAAAAPVPVAELRSTLPAALSSDRRGVLDLLDLFLGAEVEGLPGTADRLPFVDYLVTLLCVGPDGTTPLQDPVTLTSRLYGLCERADVEFDERLPALEAEFFAAADRADAREELSLRAMRRRKVELGQSYFAPRVLRAIVTYNAALLQRVDAEVLASLDWGASGAAGDETGAGEEAAAVFDAPALLEVAGALRRRAAGEPPQLTPLDRVAWCLDLAGLRPGEREALLCDAVGTPEQVRGTAILVGLLGRSAVVLDEELGEIGIPLGLLSGAWLHELDHALQQEVNRCIAQADIDGARELSELRSRYLVNGAADARAARAARAGRPSRAPSAAADDRGASEAVGRAAPEPAKRGASLRALPWRPLAGAGGLLAGLLVALALANFVLPEGGRVDRDVLRSVSPYLVKGRRSGDGSGPAFVGELRADWSELATDDQEIEAELIADGLRVRGVRNVMIYDRAGRLRIQALGSGDPRVVR